MDLETETHSAIDLNDQTINESKPFVGRWNRLISTTNWEKGAIICQWRDALQTGQEVGGENHEASPKPYSDEAWSQLVGGITPQHVGRLRRTFERFGHTHKEYDGIYWSHFYAAIEWDDAEMWLEGAVQNRWSVSRMRHQRWEVLGKIPDQQPQENEIVASELQEENQSLELSESKRQNDRDYIEGPVYEGPDFGDQDPMKTPPSTGGESLPEMERQSIVSENTAPVRPFESFVDLPEDVDEVANAFKIAIIRHRTEGWYEISKDDMLSLLDALKVLVVSGS